MIPESVHDTPCSRACKCWTPYGVCTNGWKCRHHAIAFKAALDKLSQPVVRYATAGA